MWRTVLISDKKRSVSTIVGMIPSMWNDCCQWWQIFFGIRSLDSGRHVSVNLSLNHRDFSLMMTRRCRGRFISTWMKTQNRRSIRSIQCHDQFLHTSLEIDWPTRGSRVKWTAELLYRVQSFISIGLSDSPRARCHGFEFVSVREYNKFRIHIQS